MSDDISFYKLAIWRQLCRRDLEETEDRIRQQASAPPFRPPAQDRVLFAAADEVLGWAVPRKDQS